MNGKQNVGRTRPVPEENDNGIELSSAVADKKAREHPRDDHKTRRHREKRNVLEDGNALNIKTKTNEGRSGTESRSPKRVSPSSPQRNFLNNNVRYVHNRFIVLDTPDNSVNLPKSSGTKRGVDNPQMRMAEGSDGAFADEAQTGRLAERSRGNRRNMTMDASSVTMDGREIEICLTDPENSNMTIHSQDKPKSIWKRIYLCLQDNRMKNLDSGELLNNPNEYRVLKKVLNIIFITVGVTLFVAVVVSVIYSFIVGDQESPESSDVVQPSSSPQILTRRRL
ncbi:uncharacterized protein LOC125647240 isoform X2 [Ostrea edulis]|uniref:uncharacterized protein LOC125647240 isoform X2 n=1 Tax=Ostrea edulis TaxID=37623 RepID=UPI0024AE977F|nr:uncharacterized protein LOC125647240 isoform X2 [Ostrea edulis]XP_055995863.1 uncharacterized protein LOC125647240 isoform X2 [Ostrea edulis]